VFYFPLKARFLFGSAKVSVVEIPAKFLFKNLICFQYFFGEL